MLGNRKLRSQLADPPHVVECQEGCQAHLKARLGWPWWKLVLEGPPPLKKHVEVCPKCGAEQDRTTQWAEAIARYWYRSKPSLVQGRG